MYHHIYAILVHAVCVDRNQWMAPRLVPLLEVPEGPDDPSMPQILAMKFTFLRCQPQWELTIPPINQAKPIGKHLGFQFPFIFKCPFLKFEFQNLSFVKGIRLTHTLPTSILFLLESLTSTPSGIIFHQSNHPRYLQTSPGAPCSQRGWKRSQGTGVLPPNLHSPGP